MRIFRSITLLALVPVALTACSNFPDEVLLEGTVFSDPGAKEPLGGATLQSFDLIGTPFGDAEADTTGRFLLPTPVGATSFVDIEADGHLRTSFTGVTGVDEVLQIQDGLLFAVSEALFAEWQDAFEGCPGIGEGGAVFGEVRISNLRDPLTRENPLVQTAVVSLDGPDGKTRKACYLDEEGTAFDPEAEITGVAGRFAIFGAPPGEHLLVVASETVDGLWSSDAYPVRITEGGVTPMFPLWTDFEF